ncbi:MAG: DNA-binding protein [Planctomycetota bacterium]|nr:MAG: DNA-binding protein [Planctomycetota bacterium]
MDSVYLETTVIGNIAGRLHPDPKIAARQQVTREWWITAPARYDLYVSEITLEECGDGDPDAAQERLDLVRDIDLVETSPEAEELAELLVSRLAVPASQPRDALHIAIATVNALQFLVTWNFKHILNPHLQTKIVNTCREGGYDLPVICTPQQFLETENDSS